MNALPLKNYYIIGGFGIVAGIIACILTLFTSLDIVSNQFLWIIRDALLVSWPILQSMIFLGLHKNSSKKYAESSFLLHLVVFLLLLTSVLIKGYTDFSNIAAIFWIALLISFMNLSSAIGIILLFISIILVLMNLKPNTKEAI